MDKLSSQLQDEETERLYPEDFQGAAPGEGVMYISSDEDEAMECKSFSSFYDLLSSSEDESEEVSMMALHKCLSQSQFLMPSLLHHASLVSQRDQICPLFRLSTRRTLVSGEAMGPLTRMVESNATIR